VTSPDLLYEARRVAKLRHPGIVPIHDVGRDEGVWFFVSDLMEGHSLADLNRKPTFTEAAHVVAQVADALHYAHQQGFVHRDIKPSNILLDNQGRPGVFSLFDFSLNWWFSECLFLFHFDLSAERSQNQGSTWKHDAI